MATINIDELSKVINSKSLSFEKIKEDVQGYISSLPDGKVWKDSFYSTSDGSIILTLLSGLAAFKVFHELSRVRESSLDHATVDTNVFNLAANKGYLIAPSYAPEVDLYLKLDASAVAEVVINKGDILGSLGNYYFYAADSYQITSYITAIPVRCIYGYKNEYSQAILDSKPNEVFSFITRDKYIASQLESLKIDSVQKELSADSSIYGDLDQFLLRRILYFTTKIYLGNGTIGFYNATSANISYTCISYDTDILEQIEDAPTMYSANLVCEKKTIILNPSFEPDIEQVRNLARYYPIDGRIVQDKDYKVAILKEFGSYLYDVLSYNSDTDQEITLLVKNTYTSQTLTKIQEMLDKRRALGINVNFYTKTIDLGKTFTFECRVDPKQYYVELYSQIIQFFKEKSLKFLEKNQTLTAMNLCLELSAKFGITFTPTGAETISVLKNDFFKAINVNILLS